MTAIEKETACRFPCVVETLEQVEKRLPVSFFGLRDMAREIAMHDPLYYSVEYEINKLMVGNVGMVNRDKAIRQWMRLEDILTERCTVHVMRPPVPGYPDMVFAANGALTFERHGRKIAIMVKMKDWQRQGEAWHYARFLHRLGHEIIWLVGNHAFEGWGDSLWHPHADLLWGGYGFRSDKEAYAEISRILGVSVITLRLTDSRFYHLDTAFCPLDHKTVMYYPGAFTDEGREIIEAMFTRKVRVAEEEAIQYACNSIPIGAQVIMPTGAPHAAKELEGIGFTVIGVDMSEFLKAGGAAACLRLPV